VDSVDARNLMGKLAEAYVDITGRRDKLDRVMTGVRASIESFATSMGRKLTFGVTLAGGAALAIGTKIMIDATSAANDLGEAMNKVQVTFGESANEVTNEITRMNKVFGNSRTVMADAMANLGLIAQGAGLSAEESAKLAINMTRLADDATSFYNVPLDQSLEKIRAGLVGESEPLRAFGINLTEAKVQAEALRLGLAANKNELDDQAKVMARASLITRGLAKVTGDHARTLDSNTNNIRKFQGEYQTALEELGKGLQPAQSNLIDAARDLGAAFKEAFGVEAVDAFVARINEAATGIRGAAAAAKSFAGMTPNVPGSSLLPQGAGAGMLAGAKGMLGPFATLLGLGAGAVGNQITKPGNPSFLFNRVADVLGSRIRNPEIKPKVQQADLGNMAAGLLQAGQRQLFGRLDYATTLGGMGIDAIRERMAKQGGGYTAQVFGDSMSARQSMQEAALNGANLQKEANVKFDRMVSLLGDIKEKVGSGAATIVQKASMVLRGPE
jgi:hypothetical protein